MAKEPEQIIPMPELDNASGQAKLVLNTVKGSRGLNSCAYVRFDTGTGFTCEIYGDYRSYPGATVKAAASQKNLDALHKLTFTPASIEVVKADVLAFYAKKAGQR